MEVIQLQCKLACGHLERGAPVAQQSSIPPEEEEREEGKLIGCANDCGCESGDGTGDEVLVATDAVVDIVAVAVAAVVGVRCGSANGDEQGSCTLALRSHRDERGKEWAAAVAANVVAPTVAADAATAFSVALNGVPQPNIHRGHRHRPHPHPHSG
jgi:hypothetical protein